MENIRLAELSDLTALKKLTDENIGVDYYTEEDLRQILTDPDKKFFVCTDENDVPIAYSLIIITTYAKARKMMKITEPVPGLEALEPDAAISIYKTTCTDKAYRRLGFLGQLVRAAQAYLTEHHIRYILADAMKHPSGYIPVAKTAESNGYHAVMEIPHPWSDIDSYCPYCQSRFCKCNAIIYIKEL